MQYFGFDRPSFGIKTFGFGANPDDAILALFAGGKQGVLYDPSDKSTLYQDVAGTVPVTKDGDPVGLILDKSGNGNHATQSVSAARPTYRTDGVLHWLVFDGVDDYFRINAFTSPLIQPYTFGIGMFRNATGDYRFIFDSSSANRTYFARNGGNDLTYFSAGKVGSTRKMQQDEKEVVLVLVNNTNSSIQVNNKEKDLVDIGSNNLNNVLFGSKNNGSECIQAKFYGVVFVEGDNSDNQGLKTYLASKSGVTL